MKEELLLLNKKIFRLIELAKKPNIEFSRSDDEIKKFLNSLVLLYKKRISSGKDSLEDILNEIESSFYSKEYQIFFIQQINNDENIKKWDIIDLDPLIQSYKRTKKDFEQFEKWQEAKKGNKNSTVGFFKKKYKETKIDYYCLKLGFDNYSQAKKCEFDINKKPELENESISVLGKLIKLVESSLDNLENEIINIKNSVGDNTVEEKEKINIITEKITYLIDESSSNFTILERNQEYINQELLDRQKNINNELKGIVSSNTELKVKVEQAKNEIINNQKKYSKKNVRVISLLILALVILAGTALTIYIINPDLIKNISIDYKYKNTNFKSTNPNSCKILILPFNGLDQCKEKPAKYAEVLELRYHELREKYNFDIEIISLESVNPPKDEKEARKIGEEKKADIIIWGDYAEYCKGDSDISLKYIALKNINKEEAFIKGRDKFYGNSGVQPLASIYELKKGYLQKDIDYVVFWSCIKSRFSDNTSKNIKSFFIAIIDFDFLDTRFFLTMGRNTWVENRAENDYGFTRAMYQLALMSELNSKFTKELSLEEIIKVSNLKNNEIVKDIWMELIYIMMSDKRYKEGLFFSKQIVKKIPNNSRAWYSLGNCQVNTSDTINAEKSFLKAIQLDSTNINALNNLGRIMLNTKRIKKAKEIFEKVVKKDSVNTSGLEGLGLSFFYEGNNKEAINSFHRILTIAPKSNKILYYLGEVYYFDKQFEQSLNQLNKVSDSSIFNYDALLKKGLCSIELKQANNAEEYFKKAIQSNHLNTEGYFALASFYLSKQKILEAYKIYNKILKIPNYSPNYAWHLLGEIILMAGLSEKEERRVFFQTLIQEILEPKSQHIITKEVLNKNDTFFKLISYCLEKAGKKSHNFEILKRNNMPDIDLLYFL